MGISEFTIFSIVLVIVENCNLSRLLTTTAGVVKKNSTRNRKLLIKIDLKYQNRDGIAKLPLLKVKKKHLLTKIHV